MPDQQLPPCGIGGASLSGGACSGTYTASQAGQDAFSLVDKAPVIGALIGAGLLIAGVFFAVFIVRKVGGFFGGAPDKTADADFAASALDPGDPNQTATAEWDFSESYYKDVYYEDLAAEDDTEDDSPDEGDGEPLRIDGPDGEEVHGADMTDEQFEAAEWREEARRENEA